jgi:hypothetical protein
MNHMMMSRVPDFLDKRIRFAKRDAPEGIPAHPAL